jgi:uncharacterized protein YbaP (TraB family)
MREESMKNYRSLYAALLAVYLLAGCAGREAVRAPEREMPAPAEALAPAGAPAPENHVSLWKLAAPDHTIYLLGSLHLLTPEDYPLDERFEEAYERAGTVVFETDLDALESPAMLGSMLAKAMYGDGRTLEEALPADLYAALTERCTLLGLPMDQLQPFRPWFVSLMLSAQHILRMGYDPELGVDQHYYDRARRDGKILGGLETPGYHIELLASFSGLDQEALLRETLLELEDMDAIMEEVHAAWQYGDLEAIDLLNQSLREFPAIYEALIVERNRDWIDRIVQFGRDGGEVLVIVGAAHMPGDEGLIELLRARGYAVSQY